MSGLRKCPFCGGFASLNGTYSRSVKGYFVFAKCEICGAQAKASVSDESPEDVDWSNRACMIAVNAWNMRTSEPAEVPKGLYLVPDPD